ncbi:hypothetical protein YZ35_04275 [Campylobacter lari]|uniref:hypothetical protein n=1 Tax=Campylobacter lari TaxID=201 RepID=UPI0013877694|nr:hypothetical protein [Campylobacter lari]EAI3912571.1 hypothetical protein [Campylobacter lari]EAK0953629.1 hypothetical protein [Campylobacter lari]ECK1937739.1 hypothetical protein [Campylobacter lari]MBT0605055.1 hypothetical protein [Campylobacter lari]
MIKKTMFGALALISFMACANGVDYKYDPSRGSKGGYDLFIKTLKKDYGSNVVIKSLKDIDLNALKQRHPEVAEDFEGIKIEQDGLLGDVARGEIEYGDVVYINYKNGDLNKHKIVYGACDTRKWNKERCESRGAIVDMTE